MARIVFDLDGTLVDSAPDLRAIANTLLAQRGLAPITLDNARAFMGMGIKVFIARLRAARNLPETEQAPLLADFMARYEQAVALTLIYPHVAETLANLQAAGHRLGLCTNKPLQPALALLRHLRLDHHFTKVVAGDSLPTHKPDPAPLLAAFDMGGTGPDLYVGDSEVDAETAQRAGVPLLLFTEGYRNTDLADLPHLASFSDFRQLAALIPT
ncbi:MAG: phosphoglycolate phosphatase [Rhodobacteraceae bacterium]|nr:phosphoglycolate phosphatase [Paracoccaceae bacterium]